MRCQALRHCGGGQVAFPRSTCHRSSLPTVFTCVPCPPTAVRATSTSLSGPPAPGPAPRRDVPQGGMARGQSANAGGRREHQRPDLDRRAARQGLPRRGKTDRIPAAAVKRSPQIVTELKMAVKSSGLPLITLRATRPSTRARPDERKLLPAVSPTTCATCLLSPEAQAP